eukprot:3827326-Amphidinium_carterae.1
MEARAALATIWKSMEPGHTKVAMKHLWNALLGAAGLPSDSYVDRLPAPPQPDQGTRNDDNQHKKRSNVNVEEQKCDDRHQHKKKDHSAIDSRDGQGESGKRVKVGIPRNEARASGSGHQKVEHEKVGRRAAKPTCEKASDRQEDVRGRKCDKAKDGDDNKECGRRPYPFKGSSSGVKALGKPPPPIAVDDDSDMDESQKYRERLRSMTKKVHFGRKAEEKVRLTPVPPVPDVQHEVGETEDAIPWRQWWNASADNTAVQGAPWRKDRCEREGDVLDDAEESASKEKEAQHREGYWCAGQFVPPPPMAVALQACGKRYDHEVQDVDAGAGRVQGSEDAVSRGKRVGADRSQGTRPGDEWMIGSTGVRVPMPPKKYFMSDVLFVGHWIVVQYVPWRLVGTCVWCPSVVLAGGRYFVLCDFVRYLCHVCDTVVAVETQGRDELEYCACCVMHFAGHIAGTDGRTNLGRPFSQTGIGADRASYHTLQNTHDLAAHYCNYNNDLLREAYEDAALGLLRPRHTLVGDMRRNVAETLRPSLDLLVPIVPRAGTNMNSETETIDDDDLHEEDPTNAHRAGGQHDVGDHGCSGPGSEEATCGSSSCGESDHHVEEFVWSQAVSERYMLDSLPRCSATSATDWLSDMGDRFSIATERGSSSDYEVGSNDGTELEWVQNDVVGEVCELLPRHDWSGCKSGVWIGCVFGCTAFHLDCLLVKVVYSFECGCSLAAESWRLTHEGVTDVHVWYQRCACRWIGFDSCARRGLFPILLCCENCCGEDVCVSQCMVYVMCVWCVCVDTLIRPFIEWNGRCRPLGKEKRALCHMEDGDEEDSPSEVGVDDDSGATHAVHDTRILNRILQMQRREREQAVQAAAVPGRWRPNVRSASTQHGVLDYVTLCHRLDAVVNTQGLRHEDDAALSSDENAAERQCEDGESEWLTPDVREALVRLQAIMREEAATGGSNQGQVCALADIHVCPLPGVQRLLLNGDPFALIHGVSCAATDGTSVDSTPGSIGEVWEYDYDCSSYGDSRYAEWSSSIASTPGDECDTRPIEWYTRLNVWKGDGAYRWTWSPADDSDSGLDDVNEKQAFGCNELDCVAAFNVLIAVVTASDYGCGLAGVLRERAWQAAYARHQDVEALVDSSCRRGGLACDFDFRLRIGLCHEVLVMSLESFVRLLGQFECGFRAICCVTNGCGFRGNVGGQFALVLLGSEPCSFMSSVATCGVIRCDETYVWCTGATSEHGLKVAKVEADGRCMYRSIAVSQGLDESRWKEVVADMLEHMQSERWVADLTTEIAHHAIVCARRALRHGALPPSFWPTEPHLHAYAQAKGMYLRVWNEKADKGKQWHAYGDEGMCVSIIYNGVDHYDALVREKKQSNSEAAETNAPDQGSIGGNEKGVKRRWCLVTINVSSWKQAMLFLDYIKSGEAGYDPDVIFMQEHRMEGRSGEATVMAQLQRSGYRVAFQGAVRAEKSGRACAGTLIAVKARYGIRCEDNALAGHRMVSCVLNGIVPGGVRLISMYQEVGPSAEERRSEQLHHCLQLALEDVRPFVIGADFNEEAAGVMGGLPQSPQWSIWKGNQPTCVGCGVSEIDYFIGHRSLAQLWMGTQVDMLAPTSPHRPVVAWIRGSGTPERISVLKEHGKFPLLTPVGCVPFDFQQRLDGLAQRDLNDLWYEWNECAELQLCALHDTDDSLRKRYTGKGRGPTFVQKTPKEVWAKEHEMRFPAVIRWLRMLQQFIRLQHRRKWSVKGVVAWKARIPMEALGVIIEPAATSRSRRTFLEIVDLVSSGSVDDGIMDDVQHTCSLELAKYSKDASRSWKPWARSAVQDKGGSKAHRYCKATVRHEEDTFWISDAGGGERLKVISAVWKKIWSEHSESIEAEPQGEALRPINAAQVIRAVHAVGAAKATGVDNWHARHLLQMDENMVQRFADMLNLFEHGMHPPKDVVNSITLIPKPDGGLRPIGLTPLFFRVWGRIRSEYCKCFMSNLRFESVTGVSWKTCTRAAYEAQFRLESAAMKGDKVLALMLDISKFFERIKHDAMISLAREAGFPVRLAWTAARLYRAPRIIRYGLFASEQIHVKGGVIAGCSIAMALAAVYMLRIHEDLSKLDSNIFLTGMVDDLKIETHGNEESTVERMIRAENIVVRRLLELSLPLNQKKSQVVCSAVAVG